MQINILMILDVMYISGSIVLMTKEVTADSAPFNVDVASFVTLQRERERERSM